MARRKQQQPRRGLLAAVDPAAAGAAPSHGAAQGLQARARPGEESAALGPPAREASFFARGPGVDSFDIAEVALARSYPKVEAEEPPLAASTCGPQAGAQPWPSACEAPSLPVPGTPKAEMDLAAPEAAPCQVCRASERESSGEQCGEESQSDPLPSATCNKLGLCQLGMGPGGAAALGVRVRYSLDDMITQRPGPLQNKFEGVSALALDVIELRNSCGKVADELDGAQLGDKESSLETGGTEPDVAVVAAGLEVEGVPEDVVPALLFLLEQGFLTASAVPQRSVFGEGGGGGARACKEELPGAVKGTGGEVMAERDTANAGPTMAGQSALRSGHEPARAVKLEEGVEDLGRADGACTSPMAALSPCTTTWHWRLRLGLAAAALEDSPSDPADHRRTRAGSAFLQVMPWLRPESTFWQAWGQQGAASSARSPTAADSRARDQASPAGFHLAEFFAAVRPTGREPAWEGPIPGLSSELRPYQCRAVQWMLRREHSGDRAEAQETLLHPLWQPLAPLGATLQDRDGTGNEGANHGCVFYNRFTGRFCLKAYPWRTWDNARGGMLAEEMGLGKTVELLSLILCDIAQHQREAAPSGQGRVGEEEGAAGTQSSSDAASQRRSGEETASDAHLEKEDLRQRQGGTLIVCPTAILSQWKDEILRHIAPGAITALVYNGVAGDPPEVLCSRAAPSRPERSESERRGADAGAWGTTQEDVPWLREISSADVVITTYHVLKGDIWHDTDVHAAQRSLRYAKRYEVLPTPLTHVRWWRVCLDEAQMVEGNATQTSEMASRLTAINRWCVTGTPIQKGLCDLFGLLRFLRLDPFDERIWWNRALQTPYEEGWPGAKVWVHQMLHRLMWRHSKADVAAELALPPQTQWVTALHFSAVESYFYKKQHDKCGVKAVAALRQWQRTHRDQSLRPPHAAATNASPAQGSSPSSPSLPRRGSVQKGSKAPFSAAAEHAILEKVLGPLLLLRQACCHPQIGAAGLRALHPGKPMSMDDVLQVLIAKARTEAEESQRLLVSSLNGLAAVAAIHPECPVLPPWAQGQAQGAVAAHCQACEQGRRDAVGMYREALRVIEENAAEFRADPLQRLHTLHNLALLLGLFSGAGLNGPAGENQSVQAQSTMASQGAEDGSKLEEDAQAGTHAGPGAEAEGGAETRPAKRQKRGDAAEESSAQDGGGARKSLAPDAQPKGTDGENMASAFGGVAASAVPRTLRDGLLLAQCQELRGTYLLPFLATLGDARGAFLACHQEVAGHWAESKRHVAGPLWWLQLLALVQRRGDAALGEGIADRVKRNLLDGEHMAQKGGSSLGTKFRNVSGLSLVLQQHMDQILRLRERVIGRVKDLGEQAQAPPAALVHRLAACTRCVAGNVGEDGVGAMREVVCDYCEAQDLFVEYEAALFRLKSGSALGTYVLSVEEAAAAQRRMHERDRLLFLQSTLGARPRKGAQALAELQKQSADADLFGRGLRHAEGAEPGLNGTMVMWLPSESERCLQILSACIHSLPGHLFESQTERHNFSASAKASLEAFEAMRKEFQLARAWSEAQRRAVLAVDELDMAVTRISVLAPGEQPGTATEALHRVHPEELPAMSVKLTQDKFTAKADLERSKGQLRYLKGLANARERMQRGRPAATQAQAAGAALGFGARAAGKDRGAAQGVLAPIAPSSNSSGALHPDLIAPSAAGPDANSVGSNTDSSARHGPLGGPAGPDAVGQPGPAGNSGAASEGEHEFLNTAGGAVPQEECPICQDPIVHDLAVMPCGHVLCCKCALALIERARGGGPGAGTPFSSPSSTFGLRRIGCPTCRQRTFAGDVAFVQQSIPEANVPETVNVPDTNMPGTNWPEASTPGTRADEQPAGVASAGGSGAAWGGPQSPDSPSPSKSRSVRGSQEACAGPGGEEASAAQQKRHLEASERKLEVEGGLGTKLDAVTRRVRHLLRSDPDAKILVFSSWKDVLVLVEHSLRTNGVPCIRVQGSRDLAAALKAFKGPVPLSPAMPQPDPELSNNNSLNARAPVTGSDPQGHEWTPGTPAHVGAGASAPQQRGGEETLAEEPTALPQVSAQCTGAAVAIGLGSVPKGRRSRVSRGSAATHLESPSESPSVDVTLVGERAGERAAVQGTPVRGARAAKRRSRSEHAGVVGVRVLLMSTQSGSNGLNITEAQHVLLVEPLLNPAVEAQAMNRVHRIGQTRATFVHRFVVMGTVEEGVYALNQKRAKAGAAITGGHKKEQDSLSMNDICELFPDETARFASPSAKRRRAGTGEAQEHRGGTGRDGPLANVQETLSPQHESDSWRLLTPAENAALAAEQRLRSVAQRASVEQGLGQS